jgi:small subunit ribosomal protein S16
LAVRIRLTRVGATKRPSYRVVAIDKRRARDGRALEILGFYDPLTDPATVKLEADRIQAWISKGAQPSETVVKLMRLAESGDQRPEKADKPKAAARARKPKQPAAEASKAEPAGAVAAAVEPAESEAPAAEAATDTPATVAEPMESDAPAAGPTESEAPAAEQAEAEA